MGKLLFLPAGKSLKVRPGQTLISAARAARIVIPQRCGGHASCLMCRVVVESGEVSPPSPLERRKMSESDLQNGVRLACQTKTTEGNCTIRIPESKFKSVVQAALERERKQNEDEEEW